MTVSQDVSDLNPELGAAKDLRAPGDVPSKYGNRRVLVDGILFDSVKEANRYKELRNNEQAGTISNLRTQVKFSLDVNRRRIAIYKADFCYVEDGREIVEDAKGMRTPVYLLKKKLMRAIYGIEILET